MTFLVVRSCPPNALRVSIGAFERRKRRSLSLEYASILAVLVGRRPASLDWLSRAAGKLLVLGVYLRLLVLCLLEHHLELRVTWT